LAEAHASLANVHYRSWNWDAAQVEFQRAIQLEPGSATAHFWYAQYLATVGRSDQALEEIQCARRLDPMSPSVQWMLGAILYYARQYDLSAKEFRVAVDMDPKDPKTYEMLAQVYVQRRMYPEAIQEAQKASALASTTEQVAVLAYVYAVSGKKQEANVLLKKLMMTQLSQGGSPTFMWAWVQRKKPSNGWKWPFRSATFGSL
jgi:serine/threonine-protein kinase